jgi:hypothetical protein
MYCLPRIQVHKRICKILRYFLIQDSAFSGTDANSENVNSFIGNLVTIFLELFSLIFMNEKTYSIIHYVSWRINIKSIETLLHLLKAKNVEYKSYLT